MPSAPRVSLARISLGGYLYMRGYKVWDNTKFNQTGANPEGRTYASLLEPGVSREGRGIAPPVADCLSRSRTGSSM